MSALTFPMRVRCINDTYFKYLLKAGREYVAYAHNGDWISIGEPGKNQRDFLAKRFKPVVRVKAKCVASLDLLLKRSAAAVRAMTPEARETMMQAQRQSWVRGEMALSAAGLG